MVNIIPRLVVHQDEVAKIFDPIRCFPPKSNHQLPATMELPPVLEESFEIHENPQAVVGDEELVTATTSGNTEEEQNGKGYQEEQEGGGGGVVDLLEQLAEEVTNLGYDAIYRGVVLAEDMVNLAEDYVVTLPHKASHSWWQLSILLTVMTLGSLLVLAVFFFVPLASVNRGLVHNRRFLYGTMTYFEFLGLLPWVETCNFAMPGANFTLRARILSVMIGIGFQTFVDAFIAEGWWSTTPSKPHLKVFPIPFSTAVSTSFALPVTMATLYVLTNPAAASNTIKQRDFQKQFKRCLMVLFLFLGSFVFVGVWAVVFRRLAGRTTWQVLWTFMFAPFRFICKIFILSPVLTKLNPRRWIIMNFVVDMIFTRVQVATLPFIDGYPTMISLLLTSIFTLLWRYYSGMDRCVLIMSSLWKLFRGEGVPQEVQKHLGVSEMITIPVVNIPVDLTNVPIGLISAPLRDIHQLSMSMRLHGRGAGPNSFLDWSDYEDASFDEEIGGMIASNSIPNARLEVVSEAAENHDDNIDSNRSDDGDGDAMSVCTVNLEEGGEDTTAQANMLPWIEATGRTLSLVASSSFASSDITFGVIESIASHDDSTDNNDGNGNRTVIEFEESESSSLCSKDNSNKAHRRNWTMLSKTRNEQQVSGNNAAQNNMKLSIKDNTVAELDRKRSSNNDRLSSPSAEFVQIHNKTNENILTQPHRHHPGQEGGEMVGDDHLHHHHRTRGFRQSDKTIRMPSTAAASTATASGAGESSITRIREVQWEQRQFYHVIDSIGSETLSTIVRVQHQLSLGLMKRLPIHQHLNSSLLSRLVENNGDQWHRANTYGWTLILANMIIIGSLSVIIQQCQPSSKETTGTGGGAASAGGDGTGSISIATTTTATAQHPPHTPGLPQRLTLSRVMSYIYRDHFWFLFLWLSSTGAFACATMINHFGVDFTLEFEWLSCRESDQMAWPGCKIVE